MKNTWSKIKEYLEVALVCLVGIIAILFGLFATLLAVVGTFVLVLIVQPFFWLAVIAIVLILNL